MSSSTVSITANPSDPSLRRPLLDPSSVNGKDLRHSIKARAETVLERSRDAVDQTKYTLPTNSTTKLRKRTAVKKTRARSSSRPPWKTVVRMITKNFVVLLIVLLLLALMIRKLALNPGGDFDHEQRIVDFEAYVNHTIKMMQGDSDNYERRIAEVVKYTTKMMQGDFDYKQRIAEVVKNTTNMMLVQIAGVESEIKSVSHEQSEQNSNKFKDLNETIKSIEKSMPSVDFKDLVELIKNETDDIIELNLDNIRAAAKDIAEKEISKHAADGIGRVDFAVASGGAYVLNHSPGRNSRRRFPGIILCDSVKMLQPSFGQPGECFRLRGDKGFVDIKLRTAIFPEAITLEHVSESVAYGRSNASKDCKVLGRLPLRKMKHIVSPCKDGDDLSREIIKEEEDHSNFNVLLTEFTYDLQKSSVQTFDVQTTEISVDKIRLEILSNHGSATHTCIYRVRVHGRADLRASLSQVHSRVCLNQLSLREPMPTNMAHPPDFFL